MSISIGAISTQPAEHIPFLSAGDKIRYLLRRCGRESSWAFHCTAQASREEASWNSLQIHWQFLRYFAGGLLTGFDSFIQLGPDTSYTTIPGGQYTTFCVLGVVDGKVVYHFSHRSEEVRHRGLCARYFCGHKPATSWWKLQWPFQTVGGVVGI